MNCIEMSFHFMNVFKLGVTMLTLEVLAPLNIKMNGFNLSLHTSRGGDVLSRKETLLARMIV